MTSLSIRLKPVDHLNSAQCAEVVEFVNANYKSELPITTDSVASGAIRFFWAVDEASGNTAGITGYMKKTPYLAESVKTIVAPEYRGKGVGALISQAIEDEVRRAGFKKIMSTILINNLPMIFIKLKQGYIVEGIHFDHEKPGLHEYSLGKILGR
jgi:GNAT superfamily N-acetyltransferase